MPDTVFWRRKKEPHQIYTSSEADVLKIPYVPWHQLEAVGYWGLTDDGYVTEMLQIYRMTNKKGQVTVMRKFSAGISLCPLSGPRPAYRFDWLPRKEKHAHYFTHPDAWLRREMKKSRTIKAVQSYAAAVVAGKIPDMVAIGKEYRPDQKIPEATVKRLFKQPAVKAMIQAEVARICAELGVDKRYILTKMLSVVKGTETKEDFANMRLQLKDLAELLEMFPKQLEGPQWGEDPQKELTVVTDAVLDMAAEDQRMIAPVQEMAPLEEHANSHITGL
jgi:hypothetical protein